MADAMFYQNGLRALEDQVGIFFIHAHDISYAGGQLAVLRGDDLHHQTGDAGAYVNGGIVVGVGQLPGMSKIDAVNSFLTQDVDEAFSYERCVEEMGRLLK